MSDQSIAQEGDEVGTLVLVIGSARMQDPTGLNA